MSAARGIAASLVVLVVSSLPASAHYSITKLAEE
jgi:hypothetical protein